MHLLNMASLAGFPWHEARRKWQVLDVVYLLLDLLVVAGLARRRAYGVLAFHAAALSQLALYTVFRAWLLDVPAAYRPTPAPGSWLDGLVVFHGTTLVLVTLALRATRDRAR